MDFHPRLPTRQWIASQRSAITSMLYTAVACVLAPVSPLLPSTPPHVHPGRATPLPYCPPGPKMAMRHCQAYRGASRDPLSKA